MRRSFSKCSILCVLAATLTAFTGCRSGGYRADGSVLPEERWRPSPGTEVYYLEGPGSFQAEVQEVRCWENKLRTVINFHNPPGQKSLRFRLPAVRVDYLGSVYPPKLQFGIGERDIDFLPGDTKRQSWFFEVENHRRDWPRTGEYDLTISGIEALEPGGAYQPLGKDMVIKVKLRPSVAAPPPQG